MMDKKIDNTYIPKFVANNLPWYQRDGLNTWYEQNKCNDFLEHPDKHFENLQINNFHLIFNKNKLSSQKIQQYQMIDHKEIMGYPKKRKKIDHVIYIQKCYAKRYVYSERDFT